MTDPDVPACHTWPVRTRAELSAALTAHFADRPSGFPVPAEWRSREVEYGDLMLLMEWQDVRCAVCGCTGSDLVEDHDWNTGLTRGYLCRSCNTKEGKNDGPLWKAYRDRPPTAILGMTIEYVSMMGTPTTRSQPDPAEMRRAAGMLHVPYVRRPTSS